LAGYLVVLIVLVAALGLLGGALALARLLGPVHSAAETGGLEEGDAPTVAPRSSRRRQYETKFFLVAILFVIFGVWATFFLPWGVVFRELGAPGLAAIAFFMLPLVVGLAYEWIKGGLEW